MRIHGRCLGALLLRRRRIAVGLRSYEAGCARAGRLRHCGELCSWCERTSPSFLAREVGSGGQTMCGCDFLVLLGRVCIVPDE